MRYLIDAQLPYRLALTLRGLGYQVARTKELPSGNQTTDTEINRISIQDKYVVVTKDADFVASFTLKHEPYKLLLVSTGNIKNSELEALFLAHIEIID